MHSLEDMIEKYRHELMEFSKQNPVHTGEEADCRDVSAAQARPIEKEDRNSDSDVHGEVVVRPYADYEDFERRNKSQGELRVQVFAADRSFPVKNAGVTVTVPLLNGSKELFSGMTDADGIVEGIVLPTPDKSLSLDEDNTDEPFALYDIRVSHPDFADSEFTNVPIFDSVKSIQPVELVPLTQSGGEPQTAEYGGEE